MPGVNNVFDLRSRRWQENGAGVMFGNEVNIIATTLN